MRMFHSKQLVLVPDDMQEAFDLPGRPRDWNADFDQNGLALLTEAWVARLNCAPPQTALDVASAQTAQ
jgi:hypothetical protein